MDNRKVSFIVNVEGAIHREGRWLLIRRGAAEEHAAGTLALVGGKVEAGAEALGTRVLEETLRREIQEEVGLSVGKSMFYSHSTSFVTDRGDAVINVVFVCEWIGGEAHAASPDEVAELLWLTAEEAAEQMELPEWTRESLKLSEQIITTRTTEN
ncbi:hypothetical protein B9G55_17190 [Saccharibacillus sp. O16]|nr:hypothetical protein B9G55_17190 [Saccharibacillus sp. O16]